MISLDFKLSAGQVRLLLWFYAGSPGDTSQFPMFVTTGDVLIRKGLLWHDKRTPLGKRKRGDSPWRITPQGVAMAQLIVREAKKIVEYEAMNLAAGIKGDPVALDNPMEWPAEPTLNWAKR